MEQTTTTARNAFAALPLGIVFDSCTTGEYAEIIAPGMAVYRAGTSCPEETITITRGRCLVWGLRVREALDEGTLGFLFGHAGLIIEKELSKAKYGMFALPKRAEEAEFAQAAD